MACRVEMRRDGIGRSSTTIDTKGEQVVRERRDPWNKVRTVQPPPPLPARFTNPCITFLHMYLYFPTIRFPYTEINTYFNTKTLGIESVTVVFVMRKPYIL